MHSLKMVFVALSFLASFSAVCAEQIPIESFFRLPQYAEMKLSPDGKHLAALGPFKGWQNLVVIDLAGRSAQPVSSMESRDVVWFQWVNSKRLILRTGTLAERVDDHRGGGLFAVDRDGGAAKQLSEGTDEGKYGSRRAVYRHLSFVRALPGDDDDVIVQEYVFDAKGGTAGQLYRLDTRTGRKTTLSLGKPDSADSENWLVDNHGVARTLETHQRGLTKVYYRASSEAAWEKLVEYPLGAAGWSPLMLDDDDHTLYVSSRNGRDKSVIVNYDTRSKSLGAIVASHPQVDLHSLVVEDEGHVVGVTYNADRPGTAWFDERVAHIQEAVDVSLPNAVNHLSWSRGLGLVLVESQSDVSPGSYYLLDPKTGKMEWLADRSPWIKPELMSPMRAVRYRARDGLEIPAYLTVPRGSPGRNLALVVLPHGGPWVSGDSWHFNPEVQFLASRGYAVLQPNFRGTTRYGWKHFSSSFRQWGLTMQDDIADGVLWAIKEGIADKSRVCIYGASYGGYAALMGLAKTPELYKCGIDYVGVTDISLNFDVTWSDYANSDYIKYDAKTLLGDPEKDREHWKAVSPVEQAAKIQVPVFMAYGASDRRVPLIHGEEMKAALEKNKQKFTWMVMPGEGHGFRNPENQVKFYQAMEQFLKENIGAKE
jgi:dipeptidyl aminopeptidase/acylaminoacyl peptidase